MRKKHFIFTFILHQNLQLHAIYIKDLISKGKERFFPLIISGRAQIPISAVQAFSFCLCWFRVYFHIYNLENIVKN